MPYNPQKVAALVKSKGIKAKDFFAFVYPDRSGNPSFHAILTNDNPKAETVERIADLLHCSIDELFGRQPDGPAIQVAGDNIQAEDHSTAFKGNGACDPRLLDMIDARDRQLDKTLAHLEKVQLFAEKAQQQSDRLLTLLEEREKKTESNMNQTKSNQ